MTLTLRVTTRYTSHPITGAGRIKAVAMGYGRATRHRPYAHDESVEANHLNASWDAVVAIANKLGIDLTDPAVHVTRQQVTSRNESLPSDGRREYSYTVTGA